MHVLENSYQKRLERSDKIFETILNTQSKGKEENKSETVIKHDNSGQIYYTDK
jgi:hypothetical protein